MIQPISISGSGARASFKNASAVSAPANGLKSSMPESSALSDFRTYLEEKDKKEKQNTIAGYCFSGAVLLGTMLFLPKIITKMSKNSDVKSEVNNVFCSLKEDKDIPTLDTCKSINPKLKSFLENQVMYAKADKEDIIKTGSPEAANRLIMYGPPGSGKSFFSKIFAKTIDADYMEVNYGNISRRYVGEEQERFKAIFKNIISTAQKSPDKKFVVNFNEIDSIIMPLNNAQEYGGGHVSSKIEERSIFLTKIEELAAKAPNVTFIGSTNASARGNLDGAALSRFKNVINVDYPDKKNLYEALKAGIKSLPEGSDFVKSNDKELEKFAGNMQNRVASYRDLNNVLNESKNIYLRNVMKDKNCKYKMEYLDEALQTLDLTDGEIQGIKKKA